MTPLLQERHPTRRTHQKQKSHSTLRLHPNPKKQIILRHLPRKSLPIRLCYLGILGNLSMQFENRLLSDFQLIHGYTNFAKT